jgi:hypothetical protein
MRRMEHASRVDLLEQHVEELAVRDGTAELLVAPYQIATVLLT